MSRAASDILLCGRILHALGRQWSADVEPIGVCTALVARHQGRPMVAVPLRSFAHQEYRAYAERCVVSLDSGDVIAGPFTGRGWRDRLAESISTIAMESTYGPHCRP